MPIRIGQKSLISGAAALTAGSAGVGGYFLGKRKGSDQMATALSSEFMKANQQENAQLARHYFRKGLQYNTSIQKESSMDKTAVLEQVYAEAFSDELDKVAAKMPDLKKIVDIIKGKAGKVGGKIMSGAKATVGAGKEMGKDILSNPLGAGLVAGTAGTAAGVMSERYGSNLQREGKKRNFAQYLVTPYEKKNGDTYYMKRAK